MQVKVTRVFLLLILSASCVCDPVKFVYFRKHNPTVALSRNGISNSKKDGLKTVFIVHGWNKGRDDTVEAMITKDAIFASPDQTVGTVVVVDWKELSRKYTRFSNPNRVYGQMATKQVPIVAQRIAEEIQWLQRIGKSRTNDTEIIGHGLGAHAAGQAGRIVKASGSGTISEIVGLDPTGGIFSTNPANTVRSGDAKKVRVIHTNTRKYGIGENIGDIDIHVEGGVVQDKVCKLALTQDLCSHLQAWYEYKRNELPQANVTFEFKPVPLKTLDTKFVAMLVLDLSGSMQSNGRIQSLVVASNRFVSRISFGNYLGIVSFGSSAVLTSDIVEIKDESVRKQLSSKLPTENDDLGGTSIGAGIIEAINTLKGTARNSAQRCPVLILISDGQENTPPLLADVQPTIDQAKSCLTINAIGLGTTADDRLEKLAQQTNGVVFSISDLVGNVADRLTQSYLDSINNQLPFDARPIKLPMKTVKVGHPLPTPFLIDNSIGKNGMISISSPNIDEFTSELSSPTGIKYGPEAYRVNRVNQEITYEFSSMIPGEWKLKLIPKTRRRKRSVREATASAFISSYPRLTEAEGPAIRLNAVLSRTTLEYPNWVKILAEVRQGELHPIIGAEVTAFLTSPTGKIISIRLFDNGAGADDAREDGVYSRYITNLEEIGRYEIIVIATNPTDAVIIDDDHDYDYVDTENVISRFERQHNVGSLKVIAIPRGVTRVPAVPNEVRDLEVLCPAHSPDEVDTPVGSGYLVCNITWTAAGNVADNGTAGKVLVRATTDYHTAFGSYDSILLPRNSSNSWIWTSEVVPAPAGEYMNIRVTISDYFWFIANQHNLRENAVLGTTTMELYFTVQTISSDFQRYSQISNIAPAYWAFNASINSGVPLVTTTWYFTFAHTVKNLLLGLLI